MRTSLLLLLLALTLPVRAETAAKKSAHPVAQTVPIVLTFDDGPHAVGSYAKNDTRMILRTLQNNPTKRLIHGAFFVQTHCGRMGNGVTSPGSLAVRDAYRAGNVIGIHTGSRGDHIRHTIRVRQPAEDVDGNGIIDPGDGPNGLSSDMIRAKRRLTGLTGTPILYVRPVQGVTDSKVLAVYAAQKLSYIRWNVDSHDNYPPRPSPERVKGYLHEGVTYALNGWHKKSLIILFHDINGKTATHLPEYIAAIDHAVRKTGRIPEFTTSREAVEKVFRENAEPLQPKIGKKRYEQRRKPPTSGHRPQS